MRRVLPVALVLVVVSLLLACVLLVQGPAAWADSVASAAPVSNLARAELDDLPMGTLRWYHTCPGDYNQDGLVNASDLTPLGYSLGESALPGAFPQDTQLSLIDGDQNGMLTIADMSIIGAHFEKNVLGGYNVYAADSLDEYPDSNTAQSKPGAHQMGNVALADTLTANSDEAEFRKKAVRPRLEFRFRPADALEFTYWWVRPVDRSGSEGTPTVPVVDLGSSVPRSSANAAVAKWDAELGTLSWYYYNLGDYGCNGTVAFWDFPMVGEYYGVKTYGDPNSKAGVLDGDGSGVVDEDDVRIVGDYFGNEIAGYNVYTSPDPAVYPTRNDARSVLAPKLTLPYERPQPDRVPYRPLLSVQLPEVTAGTCLWVRPFDSMGCEGTPSNLVVAD